MSEKIMFMVAGPMAVVLTIASLVIGGLWRQDIRVKMAPNPASINH
jgi:hypothetical protein